MNFFYFLGSEKLIVLWKKLSIEDMEKGSCNNCIFFFFGGQKQWIIVKFVDVDEKLKFFIGVNEF